MLIDQSLIFNYHMAQRLGFGESIPTLGIKRCDIGPGYTGYFIPLVRDVLAKQIAYVSGFGSVEVDQGVND